VQEYLRDVIEHLNRGTAKPSELLPDVWKASHPEAIQSSVGDRALQGKLSVGDRAHRKMTATGPWGQVTVGAVHFIVTASVS
jgi:hypothetical protein